MNEEKKQNVNTGSVAFKDGIDAGLNSTEDTKNWQAGNRLGQELKGDLEEKESVPGPPLTEASVPLFLRDKREGNKPSDQDEKDETEE